MQKRPVVSGLQIAFLIFATMLVSVPIGRWMAQSVEDDQWNALMRRLVPFAFFAALLVLVPAMRRVAIAELSRPVRPGRTLEAALACLAIPLVAFASAGARALWARISEGSAGLVRLAASPEAEMARAFSAPGLVHWLIVGVLIAPVLEELLCRSFLYNAFEREWGWVRAMVATSIVFGIYHPYFLNAFLLSIAFVCVLRRTQSLRAAIAAHASANLMVWWPLLGQHVRPLRDRTVPDIFDWSIQLAALAIVLIALPAYAWAARNRPVIAPTVMLEPHGALSK